MNWRDVQNTVLFILCLLVLVWLAVPAEAHHEETPGLRWVEDSWLDAWIAYLHPPVQPAPAPEPSYDPSRGAEQWRWLVSDHFPWDHVDRMLSIMQCESRGDPNAVNPSSGASGLFQVMPFWFDHFGGDPFDPVRNVEVARLIWDEQGYSAWRQCL